MEYIRIIWLNVEALAGQTSFHRQYASKRGRIGIEVGKGCVSNSLTRCRDVGRIRDYGYLVVVR